MNLEFKPPIRQRIDSELADILPAMAVSAHASAPDPLAGLLLVPVGLDWFNLGD